MKNKKKKQLPLLLLALLFITAAAYGTRAYFTDNASQNANIKLTLGNLDIENDESKWVYNGEGNSTLGLADGAEIDNASDIINVQPGDSFTRIFKFVNNGSLIQNVTLSHTLIELAPFTLLVADPIVTDSNGEVVVSENGNYVLSAGNTLNVQVTLAVPTSVLGKFNDTDSNNYNNLQDYVLDNINTVIKVEALQTNDM